MATAPMATAPMAAAGERIGGPTLVPSKLFISLLTQAVIRRSDSYCVLNQAAVVYCPASFDDDPGLDRASHPNIGIDHY